MDKLEQQELAKSIAQAVAEAIVVANAQRPPPSTTEQLQRYVAMGASGLAIVAVLVSLIGWAFQLQASLRTLSENVDKVQVITGRLDDRMESVLVGQWTRTDHDKFIAQELRPLEARVRQLEAEAAKK